MALDVEQPTRIIDTLTSTDYQVQHDRQGIQKKWLLELTSDALLAQNKILTQQIDTLTAQMAKWPQQIQAMQLSQSQSQSIKCDFCGGGHPIGHCFYQNNSFEAKVNYMGDEGRKGCFSNNNNYSQGWRNNQNQYFGGNQDSGPSNNQDPFQQQQ